MRLRVPNYSRAEPLALPDGWTLYKLQETGRHSFLWQEFKLMLPPETPARRGVCRAYTFAWSPDEERMRRDRAAGALAREHPALYEAIERHLAAAYSRAWLTAPDGAACTPDEIAAERTRLQELARSAGAAGVRRRAAGRGRA